MVARDAVDRLADLFAAVIFSLSPLPLKYLVMAWPRWPMPSTAMFMGEGLSRMRLMYSISTCTS